MDDLVERLKKLDAAATPGPWDTDSEYDDDALYSGGGGCGRGFKNFFIGAEVRGKWATLFDSVNADEKLIEEDYDEDGKSSWDAIGHANAALIVALRNEALPLITRLTAERDSALAELRQLTGSIWRSEYRATAPDWQPLPDLVGLITQLDNMYAGVREQRDAAREALWKIERNEDATYSRALARAALASWQERG